MNVLPAGSAVEAVTQLLLASEAPAGLPCRVLAIDGPGGAGKSTLAGSVAEGMGGVPIIPTDDFASWEHPLDWWERLVNQVLRPLSEERPVRYQRFDWDRRALAEWREVPASPHLILEGVSASRNAFRPYLAATVWVETGRAERLRRGLARDGTSALGLWEEWMASEDEYVARERPHERADLVISGEGGGTP